MPQAEIRLKSGRFGQLTGGLGGCHAGDRGGGNAGEGGVGGNGVSMEAAEIMSAFDPAIRQCLLELLHAGTRDLRTQKRQAVEINQPLEMCQPGVRDTGIVKGQYSRSTQVFRVQRPPSASHGAGGRKGAGGRRVRESAGQGRQGVADERANCKTAPPTTRRWNDDWWAKTADSSGLRPFVIRARRATVAHSSHCAAGTTPPTEESPCRWSVLSSGQRFRPC